MKMSFSTIKQKFLNNIGKPGGADATVIADFQINLNQRYQMVLAKMQDYMTQETVSQTTVANTQYYTYPRGIVSIESVVVTVGGVGYPLEVITSQRAWDVLNAVQFQPTAIPQFVFPRKGDYGIWPIPGGAYTVTFNYHHRDRNLVLEDYTDGTIAITNGDATVTGSSTTFTAEMAGLWLEVTDTTKSGWGRWYRIGSYTSATSLELETTWGYTTITGATYRIVQAPEIPEEGHIILCDGVTADYYAGIQNEASSATWFENKFWTGDGLNTKRNQGDPNIAGGLVGLMGRYADRNNEVLVRRGPHMALADTKVWGSSITS